MTAMRALLVMSAILIVAGVPHPAGAQDDSATSEGATTPEATALEARMLFEDGVRASRDERWAEALDAFRRSRALVPRASTLFNIAIALDRLGRVRESITTIDEYLTISDVTADAIDRAGATRLRIEGRARLGRLIVRVTPPDSSLELDGAQLAPGAVQEVDPGDHVLSATAPGHLTQRVRVAVRPGADVERAIDLEPAREESTTALLAITTDVDGALLYVDDREIGVGEASLELAPGAHRVRVVAPGRRTFEQDVTLEAGEERALSAELPRVPVELLEDPIFWGIFGASLAAAIGVGVGVGVYVATEPQPYGGSIGMSIPAL